MIEWLVLAETWFKVDERSNETVDLGKLVPEVEQRIALVDSNAL
jgi:hypothetical protein